MKRYALLILLTIVFLQNTSAQGQPQSFKILVVSPDTAEVQNEIVYLFQAMEASFENSFLMESAKRFSKTKEARSKADNSKLEWQFEVTNNLYSKIKNIKFYQIIPKLACLNISEKMGGVGPRKIAEVMLDKGRRRLMYDTLSYDDTFDYVLKYTGVKAKQIDGRVKLFGTIELLDIKQNLVIVEKEFIGNDIDLNGDLKCYGPAQCAVYNFARVSSEYVFAILNEVKK